MSRTIFKLKVHGVGLIASPGMGVDAIRKSLQSPGPGLRRIGETNPACFTYLAPDGFDKDLVPAGQRRRMSRLSRLAFGAASLALEHAALAEHDRATAALAFGTGLGEMQVTREFLETLRDRGPLLASPALFQNSVHNAAASYIAMGLRMLGPSVTLSQGWLTGEATLAAAATILGSGASDRALVVGAECFDPAWLQVLDLAPYQDPRGLVPFDPASHGVVWGESGAALVVAPEHDAQGVPISLALSSGPLSSVEDTLLEAASGLLDGKPRIIPVCTGEPERDAAILRAARRLAPDFQPTGHPQSRLGTSPILGLTLAALLAPSGPVLILNLDPSGQVAVIRIGTPLGSAFPLTSHPGGA